MGSRKILVTLESRATIGYSGSVIQAIMKTPGLEVQTIVTGSHLMPELGSTVDLFSDSGLPISASVELTPDVGVGGWSRALGRGIAGFADAFEELQPDIILLSGDRAETFALCFAASYMRIPIAHIQAGDKSGHIDDAARMAIAKLAHIHLAPGSDAAGRLRALGEEDFRIFDVGAPQLDDMVDREFPPENLVIGERTVDLSQPFLMLLQHPVMTEYERVADQIGDTLHACLSFGMPVVWIYPNSDMGYRDVLGVIRSESSEEKLIAVPNLGRDDYLALLANTACLVGNSSSGLLEAPTVQAPVVNIGPRQRGRPRASNLIDCDYGKENVQAAISKALNDPEFEAQCAKAVNPFGGGRSGEKIAKILAEVKITPHLLDKKTVY